MPASHESVLVTEKQSNNKAEYNDDVAPLVFTTIARHKDPNLMNPAFHPTATPLSLSLSFSHSLCYCKCTVKRMEND